MGLKDSLIYIFDAALEGVNPYRAVERYMPHVRNTYLEGGFKRFNLIGFGKAACEMARAATDSLDSIINGGIIITKYGHASSNLPPKITAFEAGHPLPDEKGIIGTRQIIDLIRRERGSDTLFLCLVSGGGSALFVSPADGITLKDMQAMTELFLKAGAGVEEINSVRKHISGVKGGRLAEMAQPSKIISLIVSDVVGNRLDLIASGPTAPDSTTYADAVQVLQKYGLMEKAPKRIIELLEKGLSGNLPETPKKRNPLFEKVENIIIADNDMALQAAYQSALKLGFKAEITSASVTGEARRVGEDLAYKAKKLKRTKRGKLCLISGGETTVTVKGRGKGGRNMELALAFAKGIQDEKGIALLSAGTDGTDGPTDAAGAIVDGNTVPGAFSAGLEPDQFLQNNDSYNFFARAGGLFITGPTGTNVMDIQILAII